MGLPKNLVFFGRGWRNWQIPIRYVFFAAVAELAYALDLGSSAARLVGSNPTRGTKKHYRIEDPPIFLAGATGGVSAAKA